MTRGPRRPSNPRPLEPPAAGGFRPRRHRLRTVNEVLTRKIGSPERCVVRAREAHARAGSRFQAISHGAWVHRSSSGAGRPWLVAREVTLESNRAGRRRCGPANANTAARTAHSARCGHRVDLSGPSRSPRADSSRMGPVWEGWRHRRADLPTPRKNGADDPTRTDDLLITSELLYQLSYVGPGGRLGLSSRRGATSPAVAGIPKRRRPVGLVRSERSSSPAQGSPRPGSCLGVEGAGDLQGPPGRGM